MSPDVFSGLQRLNNNEALKLYLWHVTAQFSRTILSSLWCPDLQHIHFQRTPRDPAIITAVFEFVLTVNRSKFRTLDAGSLLTVEACEVVHNIPNLRELSVAIEGDMPPPSLVLPSLSHLGDVFEEEDCLGTFRGATLDESVRFTSQSE